MPRKFLRSLRRRRRSRRRSSKKKTTNRQKSKKMRGGVTVRAQDLKTRLPEDMFGEIREMHPLLTPKLTNATIKRAVRDYLNGGARKQRVVTKYLEAAPAPAPQSLSVWSNDPDTTRRPSGETATPLTYNEARSSQKYSGRRNAPNPSALPASPRIYRSPRPTP